MKPHRIYLLQVEYSRPKMGRNITSLGKKDRHQILEGCRVVSKPILGGLHHEYKLKEIAA